MSSSRLEGKVKFIALVKNESSPSSGRDDSWTNATGMATAVGIGQVNSSVGGEPTRVTVRLGGGVDISPGVRKVRAMLPPSLDLFFRFGKRGHGAGNPPLLLQLIFEKGQQANRLRYFSFGDN